MTSICSKLISRRLLIKLAKQCTFKFNSRFLKQVDGCAMGGPLSVTFSDIYMVNMENVVVIPSKPIFYCRFADDIYSRRELGERALFHRLNSYHPNIKLTIKVNLSKFLNTKLTNINGIYNFNVCRNYLHHGPSKLQNFINEMQSMVIFIVQEEYHQTLAKKSFW